MVIVVKNPHANAGDIRDLCSIPGLGRSSGGGHGNPLQYSCLENPHGQRSLVGYVMVHRVAQSDTTEVTLARTCTRLNEVIMLSPKPIGEKEMATHSSTLAWKIPWTEEPGRLQSMGSLRVGHNRATLLSLFTFHALEKEMAIHSSVLAWRIPRIEEPGGLLSMGSHRVGHN